MWEKKDKLTEELIARIAQITYTCIDEMTSIPVGVSNRHVHLSRAHMDLLFGKDSELTVKKMLGQPGQFAAEETVKIIGPKGSFNSVRVLGPVRGESQVEISKSDSFVLGIQAPVTESGKLAGTPGITLEGPMGKVRLEKGVIVAWRHIHLTEDAAELLNVHDKQMVNVEVPGDRGCLMRNVLVRVSDKFAPEMHIDTDEANALGMKNGDRIKISK